MRSTGIGWLALATLAACGNGGGTPSDGAEADVEAIDDVTDVPEEDVVEAFDDAGDVEAEADVPPPDPCEILGLPVLEWTEAPDSTALYSLAADFTVETDDGMWSLQEAWSGCEVYLVVQDNPRQAADPTIGLWARDLSSLFSRSPRNVHYLFVSTSSRLSTREASFEDLRGQVDLALSRMSDEDEAWWRDRVHYVRGQAQALGGWLGAVMTTPAWGIGIDRFQRIRYIGSYADYRRFNSATGWFDPNVSMVANEARYYNFEAERESRLEAEGATVVEVFAGEELSDPGWAGTRGYAEVTLPDATTMAGFDTLELDHYLGCVGPGEYGDCPAWDYINWLYLCDVDDPDTCDIEFGRWITTYHREGRWVHDLSAMLPLLAEGGARRFAYYTQQPYEVHLSLRLSNRGRGVRPVELVDLWRGGAFDAAYDDLHPPITVPIPADAARVELATVISGHGGVEPENCAEFCDVNHRFLVNGVEHLRSFPEAGTAEDCMDKVEEGTVPNQYGTWWYGRSGWCPGKEVPMVTIDVTGDVVPGEDAVFEYHADYMGSPYPRSGANIRLGSWVVVWR